VPLGAGRNTSEWTSAERLVLVELLQKVGEAATRVGRILEQVTRALEEPGAEP